MHKRTAKSPCSVVAGVACKAPANGPFSARARCFGCGEPVCGHPGCSRIVDWYHYGRRRVCTNCLTTHDHPEAPR